MFALLLVLALFAFVFGFTVKWLFFVAVVFLLLALLEGY